MHEVARNVGLFATRYATTLRKFTHVGHTTSHIMSAARSERKNFCVPLFLIKAEHVASTPYSTLSPSHIIIIAKSPLSRARSKARKFRNPIQLHFHPLIAHNAQQPTAVRVVPYSQEPEASSVSFCFCCLMAMAWHVDSCAVHCQESYFVVASGRRPIRRFIRHRPAAPCRECTETSHLNASRVARDQ